MIWQGVLVIVWVIFDTFATVALIDRKITITRTAALISVAVNSFIIWTILILAAPS